MTEAAAQCREKRPPAGLQLAPATERNADAPVVAHKCTIATLRTGTRTITAANPQPNLPYALDRIHRYSGTHYSKLAQLGKEQGEELAATQGKMRRRQ